MKTIKNLPVYLALLLSMMACNDKDDSLPPNQYPLELTVQMGDVSTRVAGNDAWAGGELIGVSMYGVTGQYRVTNPAGSVEAAGTPLYWQSQNDALVSAWYPYNDVMNLNISNQAAGNFTGFDYLSASAVGSYKQPVHLAFTHSMAKVSVDLQSVTESLDHATVKIAGYTTVSFVKGQPAGSNKGYITAHYDAVKGMYEALLVPEEATFNRTNMIRITLDGGSEYIYSPTVAGLQAGKNHIFEVAVGVQTAQVVYDGFLYQINLSAAEATLKSGATTTGTTIPATVEYEGVHYPVTKWEITDFSTFANLQRVYIPASVKRIENHAFYNLLNLSEVIFADGSQLEHIGDYAFLFSVLENITIPASVKTIGEGAFYCYNNISEVTFAEGSQLERIGNYAFMSTTLETITIPASVKTIGYNAFASCSNLREVIFAEGSQLESIGIGAFYSCIALATITIPASVKTIEDGTFESCGNLGEVIFAEGSQLESIGLSTFYSCISLETITIPASVKTIGGGAFVNCNRLSEVVFATGSLLEDIGGGAFGSCSALENITIPASVKTIGGGAFDSCNNLKSIKLLCTTPPQLEDNIFYGTAVGLTIYVPSASAGAYNDVLRYGEKGWTHSGVSGTLTAGGTITVTNLAYRSPVITISATL